MSTILPKKAASLVARLLFSAGFLFVFLLCGCQEGERGSSESVVSTEAQWVTLTILHDRKLELDPVLWHEEMTVFDVLSEAQTRDSVDFESRGSGRTTFVTAIDGFEGGGEGGKNWIFSINEERSVRSCGISLVEPGDSILWEYVEF